MPASIRVTMDPNDAVAARALVRSADAAMCTAEAWGTNAVGYAITSPDEATRWSDASLHAGVPPTTCALSLTLTIVAPVSSNWNRVMLVLSIATRHAAPFGRPTTA